MSYFVLSWQTQNNLSHSNTNVGTSAGSNSNLVALMRVCSVLGRLCKEPAILWKILYAQGSYPLTFVIADEYTVLNLNGGHYRRSCLVSY